MISRIEVYGYRCFPKLTVDLGRYHVLAGANGAGKTTLLDIPVLLGDMLRQRNAASAFLERQTTRRAARAGTLLDVPHKGMAGQLTFVLEARLPADVLDALAAARPERQGQPPPTHLRYEVTLKVTSHVLAVAEECLFLFSERGNQPEPGLFSQGRPVAGTALKHDDWHPVIFRDGNGPTRFIPETAAQDAEIPLLRVPASLLSLGAVPIDPTLFPAALWFGQLLSGGVVFFDPDWADLRRPAPPGDPAWLLPTGQNMAWLALSVQRSDPDRFAAWIEHVRTALPQVARITAVEREEDHHCYFAVDYAGGYRVTSSSLSDGTLRILALTLLPFLDMDAMPSLLVTEEPENGIHPRAIETVMQSLNSLYETQVWVSTHSPIVLAHTDLADVLATRLDEDGGVSMVRGDLHPRLRDWQGSLDIGTLFAAGVLS